MPPDLDDPGAPSVENHDRDSTGMRYVYAVISRRAGGVSVGINLNPNNACNWRCVYCQVPDLVRGSRPAIDLPQLERELRELLRELWRRGHSSCPPAQSPSMGVMSSSYREARDGAGR
jgi:DNA repair photolyase